MNFPDIRLLICFDLFIMDDGSPFLQQGIKCNLVFTDIIKKNMQRKIILVFRINPVRYIPGSFTTSPLVHHGECLFYLCTIHAPAALIRYTDYTTHIITIQNDVVLMNICSLH